MSNHIIVVNHSCNLNCKYCYEHNKDNRMINPEYITRFIHYIYSNHNPEDEWIKIMTIGGEPLVSPEAIDLICSTLEELNSKSEKPIKYRVGIASNGTLVKTQKVQDLLYKHRNHIKLGFSIDGTEDMHNSCRVYHNGRGSYKDAIEGFNIAKKILPQNQIYAKATLSAEYLPRWSEAVLNLISEGFINVVANYVAEQNIGLEYTDMLFNQFATVTDWIFEHDRYKDIFINECSFTQDPNYQISFSPYTSKINCCSMCGTPEAATTALGFDGRMYPCHRFLVRGCNPTGEFTSSGVLLRNNELIERIYAFKKKVAERCSKCDIKGLCNRCTADVFDLNNGYIPADGSIQFYDRCGWTQAVVASWIYWARCLKTVYGIKEG